MSEKPFHEAANVFPLLQGEQLKALAGDIAENGLQEAIWLHEDGSILDGRNRYRACKMAGVEPRFQSYEGSDPLGFVLSLNLHRRHLTSAQKAALAVDVEAYEAEAAKERMSTGGKGVEKIPPVHKGKAREKAAEKVGTNPRYVSDAKRIKKDAPDVFERMRGDTYASMSEAKDVAKLPPEQRDIVHKRHNDSPGTKVKSIIKKVKKECKERKRSRSLEKETSLPVSKRLSLFHASVANAGEHVDPGSLDWVITDPPYPKKYLPSYLELFQFTAQALKPGGSALVMCGQSYLPQIMDMVGDVLTYQWLIAYKTPGGQSPQIWDRKVNTFWKPVLWLVKGKYQKDWVGDVVTSDVNDNDKDYHHWGQSASGMYDLMRRFVSPSDLVCDPFAGGGTTGEVALRLGCRFIGLDSDSEAIETTRDRLSNLQVR